MSEYDESSIYTPEGLDYVRMRVTAFFPSTGIEGLVHQANELITNAIDEIALMAIDKGRLTVLLCVDGERKTYQLVIRDNGRGLPIGKLVASYTKLHTSGKFDTKAYEHSGGLYGQGAKASAGTSKHFRPITHRPEGSASFYIREGKTTEEMELVNTPPVQTGVTVVYEPDTICFPTDIELFCDAGRDQLLLLLQKYCFFRRLNIEFRIHPLGLPESVWTAPLKDAEAVITRYINEAAIAFSEPVFDRNQWIRHYWNLNRPFAMQYHVTDTFAVPGTPADPRELQARYEVRFYVVKFDAVGGRFGMVNNISIDDSKSSHFLPVMDALKLSMAGFIKNAAIRKFFLEQYRISIYLAVDVKYPGYQPSGTTKHAFISSAFRKSYMPSLERHLASAEGVAFVTAFYQEIAADIESRYLVEVTGTIKVKNFNRLFEEFDGLSKRFTDCSTTNRLTAELFLVEGVSAGGGAEGRDSKTQGIYTLGGKPYNGITHRDAAQESANSIRKNRIYQEIIAITGIIPNNFDRNTLNYGRINLLTDADDHGQHIAALVTSNLYVLCPSIIECGMLHVVTPPLYSLTYVEKKYNLPKIYHRDENALQQWMAEHVYLASIDVGIRVHNSKERKTHYLTGRNGVDLLRMILAIGEAIDNLSGELVVEPHVLERLTHITNYMLPVNGTVDKEKIKQLTKVDRVDYIENGHILVLTIGQDDHIIPLQNVRERLIETVLPLLNRIQWRTIQLYITTKHTSHFKDQPISIMGLYNILKTLDGRFTIERYKGLGSMPPADKGRTCMHPEYRNSYQIFSVGDVSTIFNLLGTKSDHRKKLVSKG